MDSIPTNEQTLESLWGDDNRLDTFHSSGIELFDTLEPFQGPATPDLSPRAKPENLPYKIKQEINDRSHGPNVPTDPSHMYHHNYQGHPQQIPQQLPMMGNYDPRNSVHYDPRQQIGMQQQFHSNPKFQNGPNFPVQQQWGFNEMSHYNYPQDGRQHNFQSPLQFPQQNVPQGFPQGQFFVSNSPQMPPQQPIQQQPTHLRSSHQGTGWSGSKPERSPKSEESFSDTLDEDEASQRSSPVDSNFTLDGSYTLHVLGLPSKSRVETRMKLALRITNRNSDVAGVRDVTRFRIDDPLLASAVLRTRLTPEKRIQQKLLRQYPNNKIPVLTCQVFDSTGTRLIQRCHSCIQRERKILLRKAKDKNINFGALALENASASIVQFYCEPLVEFSSGEAILPMRLTCYCRHHQEPAGFLIKLSLIDFERKVIIAEAFSGLVMITDDRKSQRKRARTETHSSDSNTSLHDSASIHTSVQPPKQKKLKEINVPSNTIIQESPYFAKKYPTVGWVIPSEGPISGGVAVTVLGSNFHTDLSCYFGLNKATRVQLWGDSTLIATLPPSLVSGQVKISLRDERAPNDIIPNPNEVTFSYIDDSNRQLLELALQVICLKLNGNVQDPSKFATNIMPANSPFPQSPPGFYAGGYRIGPTGVISTGSSVPEIHNSMIQQAQNSDSQGQKESEDMSFTNSSEEETDEENSSEEFEYENHRRRDDNNGNGNGNGGHGFHESNGDSDSSGPKGGGPGASRSSSGKSLGGSNRRTYSTRNRSGSNEPVSESMNENNSANFRSYPSYMNTNQFEQMNHGNIEISNHQMRQSHAPIHNTHYDLLPFDIHRALKRSDGRPLDQKVILNVLDLAIQLKTPHPINFSLQNKRGHQILHLAIIKGYGEIIEKLLDQKFIDLGILDLDLQDNNGWTALHFAAFHGHDHWVSELIYCGASQDITNHHGETPFDLSRYRSTAALFDLSEEESSESETEESTSKQIEKIIAKVTNEKITASQPQHKCESCGNHHQACEEAPAEPSAPETKKSTENANEKQLTAPSVENTLLGLTLAWAFVTFFLAITADFLDTSFLAKMRNFWILILMIGSTYVVHRFRQLLAPTWVKVFSFIALGVFTYTFLSVFRTLGDPNFIFS